MQNLVLGTNRVRVLLHATSSHFVCCDMILTKKPASSSALKFSGVVPLDGFTQSGQELRRGYASISSVAGFIQHRVASPTRAQNSGVPRIEGLAPFPTIWDVRSQIDGIVAGFRKHGVHTAGRQFVLFKTL